MSFEYTCQACDAPKIKDWVQNRGGIAVWPSINLSNPGASWTTPLRDAEGNPCTKPSWQSANEPKKKISDLAQIGVVTGKKVRTLRICLRRGSQGLSIKLTDASSRNLRRALSKAGDEAWYEFGGWDGRDCDIYVPEKTVCLKDLPQGPL